MPACEWYSLLVENNIPTPKSILIGVSLSDLESTIAKYIDEYPFVRLCNASPKDICCIFNDAPEIAASRAVAALKDSARTWWMLDNKIIHLFMREIVHIGVECRCFYYRGNIRAVSVGEHVEMKDDFEELVREFFSTVGNFRQLGFDQFTLDISVDVETVDVFVVELNGFRGNTSAELFDWECDDALLRGELGEIEFRYPREFSW